MPTFTFHYVSIKSGSAYQIVAPRTDLHSTMYLLNQSMRFRDFGQM